MAFDPREYGWTPVLPDDIFKFQCSQCGECCRNVKDSIMLESLDIFRIAKFLGKHPGDVVLDYTTTTELAAGLPVCILNTKPHRDACVFLRAGKCRVHGANPRVCRTYPLGVNPDTDDPGELMSFIVSKKPHHFRGNTHIVADWVSAAMSTEDREFLFIDARAILELARVYRQIPPAQSEEALRLMIYYKYIEFDTCKDFLPQYIENIVILKSRLVNLCHSSPEP